MNNKSKQHFQFLSSLNYYDVSQYILNENKSSQKSYSNLDNSKLLHANKKQPTINRNIGQKRQQNEEQINEIYSMQYMNQFNLIKQYIETQQDSLPLLIVSEKNKGKKTLLSQIIHHYHKYHPKTKIFIPNFSSVNHIYSQILYNIMIKLRITFDINQKVQVNEQKIRRFFKYWLDITSNQIEENNLGYSKSQKQTLCIIIDGIDQLTNSRGQKVFPQFWLPQNIPKNIKLILSGTSGQLGIEKLQQQNKVKCLSLTTKMIPQKLKSKLNPKIQKLLQNRDLSLFEIKSVSHMLSTKQEIKISQKSSFNEIILQYIKECSNKLSQNQIKSLLLILSLSKKGLTQDELKKIMKVKAQLLNQFLYMFKPFINKYQHNQQQTYYLISNSQFKTFIQTNYDPNHQKIQKYHQIIAKVIKKQTISIRKLQQQIYHLTMAQNYFQIKQVLTQIQNFILLYTPTCKYLLCNTWKLLQNHLNSDPVFQYNKAIQSFLTHYHPKQEQLFKIIFQLSMFLRQYSQFQGAKIPYFRHPLIRGDQQQLQQICVYDELKQHKMTTNLKVIVKKNVDIKGKTIEKSRIKDNKKELLSPRNGNDKANGCGTISSELEIQNRNSQANNSQNLQIKNSQSIQQIQSINLQIKQNRQKFRQHYLQILKPYLKEYYLPVKKLNNNDKFVKSSNNTTQQDQDTEQSNLQLFEQNEYLNMNMNRKKSTNNKQKTYNNQQVNKNNKQTMNKNSKQILVQQLNKIKQSMILKNIQQYFEQNYHRQEKTKYYYYKEWVWIQFPWISQSLNYDFSHMIQSYIVNPTQYMNMDVQIKLIKQLIKISQVSKQNKSNIFQNKHIDLIAIDPKKLKKNRRSVNGKSMVMRNSSIVRNYVEQEQKQNQNTNKNQQNSNIAKFQLNLNKIDDKLNEQLKKQMTNRLTYDSRVLTKSRAKLNTIVNSPFITESNKQNSSILPKISSSITRSRYVPQMNRSKMNSSKSKLNQQQQTQNQLSKRTRLLNQLNTITNQNNHLKQIIQQIQKTSIMLDNINQQSQLSQITKKKQNLQKVKCQLSSKQQIQYKLKQKLQTIIKICDNNKSHQIQSQLLNLFLDNLKFMYNQQNLVINQKTKNFIENTQTTKLKIIQLVQYKNSLIQLIKEEYGVNSKLFQTKSLQDEQFTQHTIHHNSSKNCLVKKDSKNVSHNKKLSNLTRDKIQKVTISSKHDSNHSKYASKTRNRINTKLPTKINMTHKYSKSALQSSPMWEQLSKIFQFDPSQYQQSVQNTHYLTEQFEQKVTKLKQLNFLYDQLQYEKQSLIQRIQNLQEELKTAAQKSQAVLQGQKNKNKTQINENEQVKQKMKKLNQIRKRNQLLQQCLHKYKINA